MKKRLNTTGDLRQVLCDAIASLRDGRMEIDKARALGKLASQVTESIYSEAKVMELQRQARVSVGPLGSLSVSDPTASK